MTKFFFLLLSLCLISQNTYSAETVGVSNDEFFIKASTKLNIKSLVEHEGRIRAVLEGTGPLNTKTATLEPLVTRTWLHDDKNRHSVQVIHATVLCGDKTVEKEVTFPQKYPYQFQQTLVEKYEEVMVGQTVTVYGCNEYKRQDGSLYRLLMPALYDLSLIEKAELIGSGSICIKEREEFTQWKLKTRHVRNHYDIFEVYHLLVKTRLPINSTLEIEEVSKTLVCRRLKFKCSQNDGPECGSLGKSAPAGYVFV